MKAPLHTQVRVQRGFFMIQRKNRCSSFAYKPRL